VVGFRILGIHCVTLCIYCNFVYVRYRFEVYFRYILWRICGRI
jgi:hypothetical protein